MNKRVRATLLKAVQLKRIAYYLQAHVFVPETIVAATMIGSGWGLVAFPHVGSVLYVMDFVARLGMSPALFSFIMMVCGVFINHVKRASSFVLLTSPLVFYIVFTMLYYLSSPAMTSPVPLIIFGGYYGLLLSLYFLRKVEEDGSTTKG